MDLKDSYLMSIDYLEVKAIELEIMKSKYYRELKRRIEAEHEKYKSLESLSESISTESISTERIIIELSDEIRKNDKEFDKSVNFINRTCNNARKEIETKNGDRGKSGVIDKLQYTLKIPKKFHYRFANKTDYFRKNRIFTDDLLSINSKYKKDPQDIINIGKHLINRSKENINLRYRKEYLDEIIGLMNEYGYIPDDLIRAGIKMRKRALLEMIDKMFKSGKINQSEKADWERKMENQIESLRIPEPDEEVH